MILGSGLTREPFYDTNGNPYLMGGTDRSKFWVNRWDLRTDDNNLIINPPTGPDVTSPTYRYGASPSGQTRRGLVAKLFGGQIDSHYRPSIRRRHE